MSIDTNLLIALSIIRDECGRHSRCRECPFHGAAGMRQDAAQWPKIAQAYKLACGRAYERRIKAGKVTSWKSGDEMYNWWIANRKEKEVPGQRSFQFGLYNGEEYT